MKQFMVIGKTPGVSLGWGDISADAVQIEANGDFQFSREGKKIAVLSRDVCGGYIEVEVSCEPQQVAVLSHDVLKEIAKQVDLRMSQFKIELPG